MKYFSCLDPKCRCSLPKINNILKSISNEQEGHFLFVYVAKFFFFFYILHFTSPIFHKWALVRAAHIYHGTYIRWYLRSCCARKENLYFWEKIRFVTAHTTTYKWNRKDKDNYVQRYRQKICLKSAILNFPGRNLQHTTLKH